MSRATSAKSLTPALLREWPLPDSADPQARGSVLVVGGGCRLPGAALLSGVAALRAGAARLQMAVAQDAALPLAVELPEAQVMGLRCDSRGEIATSSADVDECAKSADAVLVGPGMEVALATRQLADHLMHLTRGTIVLDAGGLDAALVGRFGRARGPKGVVMTPHHLEMASMLDLEPEQVSSRPQELALEFAQHSGAVLVLKAADTYVAAPDGRSWVYRGGCAGLSVSGSGDVLAGLIAGLAARGATPEQAAAWGVYLHGRAGALLERELGPIGFLAREIAAQLPAAMAKL